MNFYSNKEIDELAERFHRVRQGLGYSYRQLRFVDYLECPDQYDRQLADRLRDWRDNPRLGLGKFTIRLN